MTFRQLINWGFQSHVFYISSACCNASAIIDSFRCIPFRQDDLVFGFGLGFRLQM